MSGITGLNIQGTLTLQDFDFSFSGVTGPYLTADKQQIVVSYKGLSYPARSDVSLTEYDYSLDSGETWEQMTPTASTGVTGLSFSETGVSQTFTWQAKSDAGTSFYNTYMRMRFQAYAGETGPASDEATTTVYFSRAQTVNVPTSSQVAFPSDYSGQSGSDLMRKAPKT